MKFARSLFISLLFLAGCQPASRFTAVGSGGSKPTAPALEAIEAEGLVLFVEHIKETSGEDIIGKYGMFRCVDFPGYWWDESKKTLDLVTGWSSDTSKEGTKIFYGAGEALSGAAGSGIGSMVIPIYDFPFTTYDNVLLNGMDPDGTVWISFGNETLQLKPGQKLQDSHSKLRMGGLNLARITTTEWFMNHGFLRPDQVIGLKPKGKTPGGD